MKCYLHPVLTCPLATDVCLDRKKFTARSIPSICNCCDGFQEVPVYWEACENVKDKVVNQQYHKDFFFKCE